MSNYASVRRTAATVRERSEKFIKAIPPFEIVHTRSSMAAVDGRLVICIVSIGLYVWGATCQIIYISRFQLGFQCPPTFCSRHRSRRSAAPRRINCSEISPAAVWIGWIIFDFQKPSAIVWLSFGDKVNYVNYALSDSTANGAFLPRHASPCVLIIKDFFAELSTTQLMIVDFPFVIFDK